MGAPSARITFSMKSAEVVTASKVVVEYAIQNLENLSTTTWMYLFFPGVCGSEPMASICTNWKGYDG